MEPTQNIDRNERIYMARQSCLTQLDERSLWEQTEQETRRKQIVSINAVEGRKSKGHLTFRIAICSCFFLLVCFSKERLKENITTQLIQIKEQIAQNWGIEKMEEYIATIMFQENSKNIKE